MFDVPIESLDAPLLGFLPGIGMPELVIMAVIVLLLFGNRLPSIMRSLGQSITEFKKGTRDGADDSNSDSNKLN